METGKKPTKIVIELSPDGSEPAVVKAMAGDEEIPMHTAETIAKSGMTPKLLDAETIMVVRTNPCQWIYINGQWKYVCW